MPDEKKPSKKSFKATTPKKVAPPPKKSHDWLPDNFNFGDVTACWAERRQEPKGSHLQWIVIHSDKPMEVLDNTWKSFVTAARESGYYVEFKWPNGTDSLWPIPPKSRCAWKTLPYKIDFV